MKHQGYIYFLCDKDRKFVKIGRSADVDSRIKALKKANPEKELCLIISINTPDAVMHENIIHRLFVTERVAGVNDKKHEWYYFQGAVVEFIKIAIESGLNQAIEYVAKNHAVNREDWRIWKDLVLQNMKYQQLSSGASSLKTH